MKATMIYKIAGSGVGLLLVGSTYFSLRKRKRDKIASALFKIIQTKMNPATNGLLSENAFDIHYLSKVLQKVNKEVLVLKTSTASKYADEINKAWGAWYQGGDDEDKVYGIFRKLKDKVQVSQVAKSYQDNHSKNLIDTLKDRFDAAEIKEVLKIVQQLPNYRTV
ncbi:hypothetical protein [Flavivirga rizhaonensis]|uniref:Annexin n=1 Tax=Flavivirga rizhaonensis TaxID=2559571 RepID=A0A4S1E142_9FLAO|nr:hypothetical protein [Flavivirga rizhaonensis]TGV03638.1 hypothetical protein EM932_06325 [Flavivirga rizhaonensis]